VSESALAPALLVAMPQLADPNFRRSVVLLVHHDDDGTFGLVLNRPTPLLALELCEGLGIEWRGDAAMRVCGGGPVQPDTGWVLLGEAHDLEAQPVADGIFVAESLEALRNVAKDPPRRARLFLGYAGWGPGQLQEELAQGAWIVAPISAEAVFSDDHDSLWERVVRGIGIDPATLIPSSGVH
jgi:putative transcriptional regulator